MNLQLARQTRLLIAEDQALAKSHIKYALEQLGFQHIDYVDRAAHALTSLRTRQYDVIVCAYDLRHEQGGYNLFEQLKTEKTIPLTTGFIFTSADTAIDVVHAIIELQPDEFLAKPFSVNELDKRLSKVVTRKKLFFDVYRFMDESNPEQALKELEFILVEPKNAEHFPLALKTKGDLLLLNNEFENAKLFYESIINIQNFTWAKLGLVQCYIHLGEFDEAERDLIQLALQPDSMLSAYDLLAELQIKLEAYDEALECMNVASDISPRNVMRHITAVQLARLTHDYEGQFNSAKKVVRFGKNSVHDTPEMYLSVARAGIDFAMTAETSQTNKIIKQSNEFLRQLKSAYPKVNLEHQLQVINARIHYLKDENEKAKDLLDSLDIDNLEEHSVETLLDSAKAFHDLGLRGSALKILDKATLKQKELDAPNSLLSRYIEQEVNEKTAISISPKNLNDVAVVQYKRGELVKSYQTFEQAFRVMPRNPAIALNLLQASAMRRSREGKTEDNMKAVMKKCRFTLECASLSEEQSQRYETVKGLLDQVV
ncbi:response regulator [Alteromonas sp. 1_MG-2023]|uniref:response regulator n=1 Tax=Alteromonas sp. 1_MG-2023 TaxID=3062669 RepID=UPI0026E3FF77|nr:response regulator [Alteromonas sp. 1_MG-2023]MDO6568863.1 response regulator [Alteromonas sp. 1_MG-2023]